MVSNQKNPPKRTQSRANQYQELFERSADAILIIEGETFIDCNQAAVEMLRCTSRREVLATHPSELSPARQPDGSDSFKKANEMIAIAHERGSHRFEWNHRRSDGEVFPVEVLLTAVDSDEIPVLHVVWRDISERRRLEERLRQSLRMEAIGNLAGGIAHDFNNVLVVILGHCSLVEQTTNEAPTLESILAIREASKRAADMVRQLMSFSRHHSVSEEVLSLRDALSSLTPLLTKLIGKHISLEIEANTRPSVLINRSQFEQILLNLAANARDAMPHGGTLRFQLSSINISSNTLMPGSYAQLSVTDTGTGMDEAEVRQAFDPFFTTKAAGEGTGIGLSTVYRIVTQCGGDAVIDSKPGEGTRIRVRLPLTQEKSHPTTEIAGEQDKSRGGETILLVDDDSQITDLLATDLRKRGYTVMLASNGQEALDLVKQRGLDCIALVVSDVVMPQMTGPVFVRRLLEEGYNPKVLFMSSHTDDALAILEGHTVSVVSKPFTPQELALRVRKALDEANDS